MNRGDNLNIGKEIVNLKKNKTKIRGGLKIMKKVINAVSKMYKRVICNQRLLDSLTVIVFVSIFIFSFSQSVMASGTTGTTGGTAKGVGADPFTKIMDIICGLLQKIGGVVAFVGAFMIIWGIKDHNPDTKMNGITTAAVGGGLFTLASMGNSFLN